MLGNGIRPMEVMDVNGQTFVHVHEGRLELEIPGNHWVSLNGPLIFLLSPLDGKRGWVFSKGNISGDFEIAGEGADFREVIIRAQEHSQK